MNETYGTKNRWADKMVFFGLFIAVMLIAYSIVVRRSAIVLSEPIELNCAGLSVCMPTGTGWVSWKKWRYQQNTFILDSFFASGSGSVTTLVSCRYLLAAAETTAEVLFEEKASAVSGAEIEKTGKIETGFAESPQNKRVLSIDWAYIKGSKTLFDTFFGVAQLPDNRRLEIEVYQDTSDMNPAEEIFKSVIESLKLTDNKLLDAGGKIVAEIKGRGIDSFFASVSNKQGWDREDFFMIKDAREHTIGFTMDLLASNFSEGPQNGAAVESLQEAQLNILAWSSYYIRGQPAQEQVTFFRGGNNLNEFIWKSETSGPGGRSGVEIVLDKNGIMTVKESGLRAKGEDYHISPAAIPSILDEFILSQMLDSDRKEILVDIIESNGKITPSLVSRTDANSSAALQNQNSKTNVAGEGTVYVFKIEFLNGRGFSQQVYLDGQRQISRMLLKQESTYTLERTDAENILREFPKEGSYILQRKDKILEQSQLQEGGEQQQPSFSY